MSAIARQEASVVAQELARILQPACEKVAIAGSVRRKKAQVNDIEILAIPRCFGEANALLWLLDQLLITEQIRPPERKCWGAKHRKFFFKGIKIDLFTADGDNWGYQYWLRTGPKASNALVMKVCWQKKAPWKAKDGYLWHGSEQLHIPDEEALFAVLGLDYLAPEQRLETTYKRLFAAVTHQWGTNFSYVKHLPLVAVETGVEQAPLQQKTLFDMNALYTEHYGDSGVKVPPPEAPYHWDKPFLTDNGWVWYDLGYGDWGVYPKTHSRIRERLKSYQLKAYRDAAMKRLLNFKDILYHQAKRLSWDEEAMDLYDSFPYEFRDAVLMDWNDGVPSYEHVPLDKIVCTQTLVIREHLQRWAKWIAQGRYVEDGKPEALAVVMKFKDDERYFMSNGHHRYFVSQAIPCLNYLPCYVDYVDMPLKDALMGGRQYVPTRGRQHLGFLRPEIYEAEAKRIEPVPVLGLIRTMPDVDVTWLDHYYLSGEEYDANEQLVEIVQFNDGNRLIRDGHHRVEAALWKQKEFIRAQVIDVDMSYYSAVLSPDIDEYELAEQISELYQLALAEKDQSYAILD